MTVRDELRVRQTDTVNLHVLYQSHRPRAEHRPPPAVRRL